MTSKRIGRGSAAKQDDGPVAGNTHPMAESAATSRAPGRLSLGLRRVGQLIEHGVGGFFSDGMPQRAAAISFYALFSVFPLAILCVAVLGVVANDADVRRQVVDFLLNSLPLTADQGRRQLERLLLQVTDDVAGFSVLGVLTLLFAASGVMGAIRQALNAAFNAQEQRPPVQAKLWDLAMVLAFGVLVTLSFALTLADEIRANISRHADEVIRGSGGVITRVLIDAGRVVPLIIAIVIFAGLFRVVPAERQKLRDTWPGVLVAAFGYEVAKLGFTIYLTHFADYGAVYASLGSVIAFLVFVFVAANVALLGAEMASEWRCVRAGEYDGPPGPPFLRQVWDVIRSLFVRTR
jgi:membrane protein